MVRLVWDKNDKVNTLELAKIGYKAVQPTITHKNLAQKPTNVHNEEKIAELISDLSRIGVLMRLDIS